MCFQCVTYRAIFIILQVLLYHSSAAALPARISYDPNSSDFQRLSQWKPSKACYFSSEENTYFLVRVKSRRKGGEQALIREKILQRRIRKEKRSDSPDLQVIQSLKRSLRRVRKNTKRQCPALFHFPKQGTDPTPSPTPTAEPTPELEDPVAPVCGNGLLEEGEVCEVGAQVCTASSGYPGFQQCNSTCSGYEGCESPLFCGDDICTPGVEGPENCPADCEDFPSGTSGPPAIAVWGYPDGVTLSGTVSIGVVAYHQSGIAKVEFFIDGVSTSVVTKEVMSPRTGEMEWILTLDTTTLSDDTPYAISATAYPYVGSAYTLPELTVSVENRPSFQTWYVDSVGGDDSNTGAVTEPFRTIRRALQAARSGDEVLLNSGAYHLQGDKNVQFTRFVTIRPNGNAQPRITSSAVGMPTNFLKFKDLTFDFTSNPNLSAYLFSAHGQSHHFWFDGCTFQGPPNRFDNYMQAIRVWGSVRDVTVENCRFFDVDRAVVGQNRMIVRGNDIGPITSDAIDMIGDDILVSSNAIHDIQAPRLYIQTENTELFDLSVNTALSFFYDEFDTGNYTQFTFPDVGANALDPSNVTAAEVVSVLNASGEFRSKMLVSHENGTVIVSPRRTNYEQHLYVLGSANVALGFAEEGKANEAKGSGQHADVFQMWGGGNRFNIIRNNKVTEVSSQVLLVENPVTNFAFVNNLIHGTSNTWSINLPSSDLLSNILFAHNTIGDSTNVQIFNFPMNTRNFVHVNNLMWSSVPQGDINNSTMRMDFNVYDTTKGNPALGPNSINTNPESIAPFGTALFNNVQSSCSSGKVCNSTGDFSHHPSSPAIDFGTAEVNIPYDIDWNPRVDGMPDAGAYEFQ